jgi:hypothetical protein
VTLLLQLCALHFLCDFPLQGDFLARAKNPNTAVPGVPWPWALAAHSGIQAGGVLLVMSWPFAVAEFFSHFLIDWVKCAGGYSFACDQYLHLCIRCTYAGCALWGIS